MPNRDTPLQRDSWLVAGGRPSGAGAPLNPPLELASNFRYGASRSYARDHGTAAWCALEDVVGGLERGTAVAYASGMAAAAAVLDLVPRGARVVLPADCYQGVAKLAAERAANGAIQLARLATSDTAGWVAAARSADLLWIESPSNPLLVVADVAAICGAPRRPGALCVVDNTFATPLRQRPLERGADVVVHSATKFIGGHSNLLCGIAIARSPEHAARLHQVRELTGATPGALEAFLALRGVRTLAVRLARAEATALELATLLSQHALVENVLYPGLPSHPTHALAKSQLDGPGAMLSFEVRGGAPAADAVCRSVELVQHATSLGGVESTIERRAALQGQEHVPPGLLRLSVGIESPQDLWNDLARALGVAAH